MNFGGFDDCIHCEVQCLPKCCRDWRVSGLALLICRMRLAYACQFTAKSSNYQTPGSLFTICAAHDVCTLNASGSFFWRTRYSGECIAILSSAACRTLNCCAIHEAHWRIVQTMICRTKRARFSIATAIFISLLCLGQVCHHARGRWCASSGSLSDKHCAR